MSDASMTVRLLLNARPIPAPTWAENGLVDITIDESGVVRQVTAASPENRGRGGIDLQGAYISRGWIDLHTHIYYGATDISIRPNVAGMATGVTTLVDAGSSGEASFAGFREYIAGPAQEKIYAFLNLGSIGLVACNRVSELADIRSIDIDRTLRVVQENRDIICGIKVRASHVILGSWGITPLLIGKKVARMVGLPLMVHIGEPPPLLDEILPALDPGDIITHCFNGKAGGNIADDEVILAVATEAHKRGILFDVGHGGASFSYRVARKALERGLIPWTISTDLHMQSVNGPAWDLATTMSKLYSLGMDLEDIVHAVTDHSASSIGRQGGQDSRWLSVGQLADFTVFETASARIAVSDSEGSTETLDKVILPRYALRGSALVAAHSRVEMLAARSGYQE